MSGYVQGVKCPESRLQDVVLCKLLAFSRCSEPVNKQGLKQSRSRSRTHQTAVDEQCNDRTTSHNVNVMLRITCCAIRLQGQLHASGLIIGSCSLVGNTQIYLELDDTLTNHMRILYHKLENVAIADAMHCHSRQPDAAQSLSALISSPVPSSKSLSLSVVV